MKTQTVASYFRYSLMDLLSKMVAGQPHFVRCIKPNNDRLASKFDREKVLVQLRYTGILETARIRRMGYSHRLLFANFIKRYHLISYKSNEDPPVSPESCLAILEKANLENWILGKTKVFLKYYHVEQLDRMVKTIVGRIVFLQACVKGWLGAKRYKKIQLKMEQSAVKIQSAYRGYAVRKETEQTKQANTEKLEDFIIRFQAVARGYIVRMKRNEMLEMESEAATKIQSHYRGFKQRKSFQRKRESMKKKESESKDGNTGKDEPDEKNHESEISNGKSEEEAAVVIQSHIRGHKESHHKVSDEGDVTDANDKMENLSTAMEEEYDKNVDEVNNMTDTEDRAATIIQSNYRGHRDRKKLQEERNNNLGNNHDATHNIDLHKKQDILEVENNDDDENISEKATLDNDEQHAILQIHKSSDSKGKVNLDNIKSNEMEMPTDKDKEVNMVENQEDLEKAAVVIQSSYRGLREREQLKKEGKLHNKKNTVEKCDENEKSEADIQLTLLKEIEDLSKFTEEISKLSENYLSLQQHLNDLILSNQLKPEKTAVFLKGQNTKENKTGESEIVTTKLEDVKPQRAPRRQKPKTLSSPDDSMYYNLLHLPAKNEKRKPRKESQGIVLDSEDYYKDIYSSYTVSINDQNTYEDFSANEFSTEKSSSVPEIPLGEGEIDCNPYDYRKLLRKTSQRERLIQKF